VAGQHPFAVSNVVELHKSGQESNPVEIAARDSNTAADQQTDRKSVDLERSNCFVFAKDNRTEAR
jgi:hypothetical protein